MHDELLPHRSSLITFILLALISIVLMTANLTGYVSGLRYFVYYIVTPTPETASLLVNATGRVPSTLRDVVLAHQENIRLRKQLEKYSYLETEWTRTREQNVRLRELVDFPVPPSNRSVVARVVIREPGSWFQWVVIDRGLKSGLFVNAPVLVWAGGKPAVVGRVGEVYPDSAKVVLMTSVLSSLPVKIASSDQDGLLEGQNTPELKMNYILPETVCTPGEELVTSALSAVFPQGMSIGTIQRSTDSNDAAYRAVTVHPTANFNNLKEVLVLVPEGPAHHRPRNDSEGTAG